MGNILYRESKKQVTTLQNLTDLHISIDRDLITYQTRRLTPSATERTD